MENEQVAGIRNQTGNSEVVWIPSSIDMGAWLYGNAALSQFLADEVSTYSAHQPFTFTEKNINIGMQTMYDGNNYLTVITNGLDASNKVQLENKLNKKTNIVFCTDTTRKVIHSEQQIELSPGECLVLFWE